MILEDQCYRLLIVSLPSPLISGNGGSLPPTTVVEEGVRRRLPVVQRGVRLFYVLYYRYFPVLRVEWYQNKRRISSQFIFGAKNELSIWRSRVT